MKETKWLSSLSDKEVFDQKRRWLFERSIPHVIDYAEDWFEITVDLTEEEFKEFKDIGHFEQESPK